MALQRDAFKSDRDLGIPDRERDRILDDQDVGETGRSNSAAFLLGGVVIAGGLLGFLYYDTDNLTRGDSLTTGSITQTMPRDEVQSPPVLRIPVQPQQGSAR